MKLIFIDCGVSQSETPQRIIERLEETLIPNNIEVLRNPSSIQRGEYLIVRWGSPRFAPLDENSEGILNQATKIEFNINKFMAHQKMFEDEVSVPRFWSSFNTARTECLNLGCDFLRRRKSHTQGRDIIRLSPRDNLPRNKRSGYYVQMLEKDAEYRLHIFKDECIGLAKKEQRENANPLIWNFENGWDLVYIPQDEREEDVPHYNKMKEESIKAIKSLGLDFGAVDLIMVGNKPYVLEVNTAPKLYQTKRYSKNIIKWMENVLERSFETE